jgi:hypothetical protein
MIIGKTSGIKIFDIDGNLKEILTINDDIDFSVVDGRVLKGTKCYYKGIGVPYSCHFIPVIKHNEDQYDALELSDVFYMGLRVAKKSFIGKQGIFQEPYQTMFSDFIGTCGVKELSIIENSMFFEMSSAEILDSVNYDTENMQYYFKVNYKCGRSKYIQTGDPHKLRSLIEYMLDSHWNIVWDKDSITDISANGMVTDVGELFVSKLLENKFGTVYSILYSLGKRNFNKYLEFLDIYDLNHETEMSYVFNAAEILKKNNIDTEKMFPTVFLVDNYKHIVLNYLLTGRNCGHCSFVDVGDKIKDQYIAGYK